MSGGVASEELACSVRPSSGRAFAPLWRFLLGGLSTGLSTGLLWLSLRLSPSPAGLFGFSAGLSAGLLALSTRLGDGSDASTLLNSSAGLFDSSDLVWGATPLPADSGCAQGLADVCGSGEPDSEGGGCTSALLGEGGLGAVAAGPSQGVGTRTGKSSTEWEPKATALSENQTKQ